MFQKIHNDKQWGTLFLIENFDALFHKAKAIVRYSAITLQSMLKR